MDVCELAEDLGLLLLDGRHIQGADVYRYVMRRIWWSYPVYLISVLPFLKNAFDWGYRAFASHRHQVSRLCRLPGAG
jgi:NAD(P)H-dependent FMN reductase